MSRRRVIGVMGSGRHRHEARARQVGVWIARAGYHLLTGAGSGVMAAVSEAFVEVRPRAGLVLGVVPADATRVDARPPPGYPNRSVEIAIRTHLTARGARGDEAHSRNHVNVLSSDILIILPGGDGTASEARLAVRYARPCIAYLDTPDQVPGLPAGVPVEPDFERVQRFVRGV